MAEEQVKKVEAETPAAPAPAPALAPAPAPAVPNNDVAEEKAVTQLHDQEKPVDDSKALAVVDRKLSLSLSVCEHKYIILIAAILDYLFFKLILNAFTGPEKTNSLYQTSLIQLTDLWRFKFSLFLYIKINRKY